MRRFTKDRLIDPNVVPENPDLDVWPELAHKEFLQTVRNTGRIEQLEAKHENLEGLFREILTILQTERMDPKTSWRALPISWRVTANMPDVSSELEETSDPWIRAITPRETVKYILYQLKLPYHENLSKIAKLFGQLEEDFDDIPNRIVRCELLEKELSDFENSLEGDETENLAWCVSLIRDVLDYNNAENLTETHLGLLKKAIKLISEKGLNCNKEEYKNLHREFLEAGIALIPTTQKAIDKYGE